MKFHCTAPPSPPFLFGWTRSCTNNRVAELCIAVSKQYFFDNNVASLKSFWQDIFSRTLTATYSCC